MQPSEFRGPSPDAFRQPERLVLACRHRPTRRAGNPESVSGGWHRLRPQLLAAGIWALACAHSRPCWISAAMSPAGGDRCGLGAFGPGRFPRGPRGRNGPVPQSP